MESYVEGCASENAMLRRKLQSKTEAVLILSKDLNKCRSERDQFKLLVDELQHRLASIKRNVHNKGLYRVALYTEDEEDGFRPGVTVAEMLRDAQKRNKALRMEIDDLKQQLSDAGEDMEALRSNYARHRCGNSCRWEGQVFPNHPKEELIQQLETLDTKCSQLQVNLQALLDEKEELIQERDTYKFKVHRLNHELSTLLKAKQSNIDIDALVTENRYLHERLLQTQEEFEVTQRSLQKYKAAFDQTNKSSNSHKISLATFSPANRFISQSQVRELLEAVSHPMKSSTPAFMESMRNVCQALFDSLEDKSLRLVHQKKANRILAKRIVELESLAGERGTPVFPSMLLLEGYSQSDAENTLDKFKLPEKEVTAKTATAPENKENCDEKKSFKWRKSSSSEVEDCQPLPPGVRALVEQALEELRQESSQPEKIHVTVCAKDNL